MPNIVSKINLLEEKHRTFITLVIKPLLSLIVFLSVGYYTMWLSTNYVRQDKFAEFVNKQFSSDERQDEAAKARFETTQAKLELIINQQIAFNEQLKTFNQMMTSYQKQYDNLQERILYLERNQKSYSQP